MKTKLAVVLSLHLSFAGAIYMDALDIGVDLDEIDQDVASAVVDHDRLVGAIAATATGAVSLLAAVGK